MWTKRKASTQNDCRYIPFERNCTVNKLYQFAYIIYMYISAGYLVRGGPKPQKSITLHWHLNVKAIQMWNERNVR